MGWFYLNSGAGMPAMNMALDEALMLEAREIGPVLRFYSWSDPAATFGYFQNHADVSAWTTLRPLIRRPTGGGLVPHDADWTYSVVIPSDHEWHSVTAIESYRRLHSWVQEAFRRCRVSTQLAPARIEGGPGQCFIGAEQFDLLAGGQKLAGAAQRRSKTGLLIQGSIQPVPRDIQRSDWEAAMLKAGEVVGATDWKELLLSEAIGVTARRLARDKYSQASHNLRR